MQLAKVRKITSLVPQALRPLAKGIAARLSPSLKAQEGMAWWDEEWAAGRFELGNGITMLALANQPNDDFVKDKICADFGCGPMGTLTWAKSARARIGIDLMADAFTRYGIAGHDMVYVISSERKIPLPSDYIDVLFSVNSLDHVNNLRTMCDELIRILAPGGWFFGSFNLGEPPTLNEPITLTESLIDSFLLNRLEVESRLRLKGGPTNDGYKNARAGILEPEQNKGFLWVRARKTIA